MKNRRTTRASQKPRQQTSKPALLPSRHPLPDLSTARLLEILSTANNVQAVIVTRKDFLEQFFAGKRGA